MKMLFGSILVLTLLFGGYVIMKLVRSNEGTRTAEVPADNVHIVDGVQMVDLRAKVGFSPRVSTVKAGMPTTLRVSTDGTFDCSSSLRIPSMNIAESLPATGETEIALGTLALGVIDGTCSMGMYPFQLNVVN